MLGTDSNCVCLWISKIALIRTVGVYVKDLLCSHINHLIQEIGVQKEDLMTWIVMPKLAQCMMLEVGNSSQAPR